MAAHNTAVTTLFLERDILRAGEIGPVYTYNRVIRPVEQEAPGRPVPTLREICALTPDHTDRQRQLPATHADAHSTMGDESLGMFA